MVVVAGGNELVQVQKLSTYNDPYICVNLIHVCCYFYGSFSVTIFHGCSCFFLVLTQEDDIPFLYTSSSDLLDVGMESQIWNQFFQTK